MDEIPSFYVWPMANQSVCCLINSDKFLRQDQRSMSVWGTNYLASALLFRMKNSWAFGHKTTRRTLNMKWILSLLKRDGFVNKSLLWMELRQAVWSVIITISQFPIFHKAQGLSVGAFLLIFLWIVWRKKLSNIGCVCNYIVLWAFDSQPL